MITPSHTPVGKYLDNIPFPTEKQALLKIAKAKHVPDKIMEVLYLLDEREYVSPTDIAKEISKLEDYV